MTPDLWRALLGGLLIGVATEWPDRFRITKRLLAGNAQADGRICA